MDKKINQNKIPGEGEVPSWLQIQHSAWSWMPKNTPDRAQLTTTGTDCETEKDKDILQMKISQTGENTVKDSLEERQFG